MNERGRSLVGAVIAGDFEIQAPLARGAAGQVYVARQVSTGRRRAIKVLHADLADDHVAVERFRREASIGARVQSAHIVEVISAGFDPSLKRPWLAMELLEGQNLAERIAAGPISVGEAGIILGQLCDGLSAIHSAGIIHRDLKPENIYVAKAPNGGISVKILDLGIAKLLEGKSLTGQTTLGTPRFMAPEQTQGGDTISPAADVWSLACVAFRMLTGQHYWHGRELVELLLEIMQGATMPASARAKELGGAVPAGFDAWFARCLSIDPNGRFPNAAEAWSALAPLLPQPAAATTKKAAAPTPETPSTGRSWLVTIAIVALAALAGVGAGLALYWALVLRAH
ncbi:MAG: serine/threonine-protein kinase [Polyangiaceae bacterium]